MSDSTVVTATTPRRTRLALRVATLCLLAVPALSACSSSTPAADGSTTAVSSGAPTTGDASASPAAAGASADATPVAASKSGAAGSSPSGSSPAAPTSAGVGFTVDPQGALKGLRCSSRLEVLSDGKPTELALSRGSATVVEAGKALLVGQEHASPAGSIGDLGTTTKGVLTIDDQGKGHYVLQTYHREETGPADSPLNGWRATSVTMHTDRPLEGDFKGVVSMQARVALTGGDSRLYTVDRSGTLAVRSLTVGDAGTKGPIPVGAPRVLATGLIGAKLLQVDPDGVLVGQGEQLFRVLGDSGARSEVTVTGGFPGDTIGMGFVQCYRDVSGPEPITAWAAYRPDGSIRLFSMVADPTSPTNPFAPASLTAAGDSAPGSFRGRFLA